MLDNNNARCPTNKDWITTELLENKLQKLKKRRLRDGVTEETLRGVCHSHVQNQKYGKMQSRFRVGLVVWPSLALLATAVLLAIVVGVSDSVASIMTKIQSRKCALENNFFVMEMTRPITDCNICRDTKEVTLLQNVSRSAFAQYAYSSQPILVRGATSNWKALETFSFNFFKRLYAETRGAVDSVEDECQFFPFRTEFVTLEEVLNMPDERANLTEGQAPWYIGWSNCNPDIAAVLRKHYHRPHFLPEDSESSAIDWIFMGGSGPGASLHLDYVHRPSWQAQVSGTKTWHLVPPPECEDVCTAMDVTVHQGDILLVDTNQWYHDTYIHPGQISITIGSEYD